MEKKYENLKKEALNLVIQRIRKEEGDAKLYFPLAQYTKTAKTYMAMNTDMEFMLEAIEELITYKSQEENKKEYIEKALWVFLIITYGKCFTDATKSKQTKLEARECFKGEGEKFLVLHNEIMRMRHEFVAHRGDNEFEQTILYFKILEDKLRTIYKLQLMTSSNGSLETLNLYKNLLLFLKEIVFKKMNLNISKLHAQLISGTAEENDKKFYTTYNMESSR